jgi:hypothetical protein
MTNLALRSVWDPHAKIATAAEAIGPDEEWGVRDSWISHTGRSAVLNRSLEHRSIMVGCCYWLVRYHHFGLVLFGYWSVNSLPNKING